MSSPDVLIVGASARAAAESACRAGLQPSAIDLFADRDLVEIAPVVRVAPEHYPEGLLEIANDFPSMPWIYTGALENHPDLIDRLASRRPLWGNPGAVVQQVRDPFLVAEVLRRAEIPVPQVRGSLDSLPRDGSWMLKPIASAGGRHLEPLTRHTPRLDEPCFAQERIEGLPIAAIWVGSAAGATLGGVTRQLLGHPGAAYAYRGSLGPWPLEPEARERLLRLGAVLVREFGLRGIFGTDMVLRDGIPWLIEINPRYTASVEVLERATGAAFLAEHGQVFEHQALPLAAPPPRPQRFVGKAILFAERSCTLDEERWRLTPAHARRRGMRVADIPSPGETISAGQPVLSVFSRGTDLDTCARRLERVLCQGQRRLREGSLP